jgi:hypothetical protein
MVGTAMTSYTTDTGFHVLVDSQGRIGGKANVPQGEHPVPDWVDDEESFDVASADELANYEIDSHYRDQ